MYNFNNYGDLLIKEVNYESIIFERVFCTFEKKVVQRIYFKKKPAGSKDG